MLIRAPMQRIDSAKCIVAQRSGFLRAHPAQHNASGVSVPCWIAGELPRFGSEGGALGQGRRMRPSLAAQVFNRIRCNAAGVSTCQPHATPCIAMVGLREREDGAGNPAYISAVHKPQASAQSLIEDMAGVMGKPQSKLVWPALRLAMEVTFMETVTVDRQPAQDHVQLLKHNLNTAACPGKPCVSPSGAHVKHKDVVLARPGGKLHKRVVAKADSIQQSQRHPCAFISKA